MHDLNAFQRDCLVIIAGSDGQKGLEIKDQLHDYYSSEVFNGRLYPNLNSLADKGLIEKGKMDERSNSYAIGKRGRRELEARRQWENSYLDFL